RVQRDRVLRTGHHPRAQGRGGRTAVGRVRARRRRARLLRAQAHPHVRSDLRLMARAQESRRGMTGGQVALVLVVTALVVVFLVMLAGRLTGDDDGGTAASPDQTTGTSAEPTGTGTP